MPTRKQLRQAEALATRINWPEMSGLSDREIRQRWKWDKDMTWPTDKELADFDLIVPAKSRRRKTPQAAE